jgi:hypothetical protein
MYFYQYSCHYLTEQSIIIGDTDARLFTQLRWTLIRYPRVNIAHDLLPIREVRECLQTRGCP